MSGNVVIRAEGLGKKYVIGHAAEREHYTACAMWLSATRELAETDTGLGAGPSIVTGDTTEEFWPCTSRFEIRQARWWVSLAAMAQEKRHY